jgi:hypothetical protein
MQFEGAFRVPGKPDDVIVKFTDVERMAKCMPGASIEGTSEADLQGVLADFAKTGGAALANVIMEDFAKRLAAEFSEAGDSEQAPAAISAHKVVWRAIKAKLT